MSVLSRIFAVAAILAATFISASALAASPTMIRIGMPDQSANGTPSGGIGLLTYLDATKALANEFAKDNIKVEFTYFKGAGPAINEAIANKQLDFVYLGDLASIIGRSNGLATRLIVPLRGFNAYLAVTPDSGIKSAADLRGKRVTVFKGTAYQLQLDRVLATAGLTERDLQVVNLDWNAALAAIAAKQLDANWASAPALTLRDKGLADIPVSSKTLGPKFTFQGGFIATQDFIDAYPELTQRFVDVVVHAQHDLSQQEKFDTFLKLTADYSGTPIALGKAEFEGDDLKFRFSPRFDDFVTTSYQASVDEAKALGLIRKPFAVTDWIEPKFVTHAIAVSELQGFWPAYDKEGKPQ